VDGVGAIVRAGYVGVRGAPDRDGAPHDRREDKRQQDEQREA
jgi:hypothetical protein